MLNRVGDQLGDDQRCILDQLAGEPPASERGARDHRRQGSGLLSAYK
ncbi:hypothetical protein ACGFWI_01445 [Streptomyces sp. NPDC048434]